MGARAALALLAALFAVALMPAAASADTKRCKNITYRSFIKSTGIYAERQATCGEARRLARSVLNSPPKENDFKRFGLNCRRYFLPRLRVRFYCASKRKVIRMTFAENV